MCSIGKMPNATTECSNIKLYKRKKDFSASEWSLLKYRSGIAALKTCCNNHEILYLKTFLNRNVFCCDPQGLHPDKKKKMQTRISLSLGKKSSGTLKLVPWKGLCKTCVQTIIPQFKSVSTPPSDDENDDDSYEDKDDDDNDERDESGVTETQAGKGEKQCAMDVEEWTEDPYVNISTVSSTVDFAAKVQTFKS